MRKILDRSRFLFTLALAVIALGGCAGEGNPDVYHSSRLEKLPFVYKMTVQQGNILTEEQLDQLKLGMNKRQVQYLLGTPLLTDIFHQERWDYLYTLRHGHQEMKEKKLSLFFQDDVLVRWDGNMLPDASRATAEQKKEIVVSVPDYEDKRGFFRRTFDAVGLGSSDTEAKTPTAPAPGTK